MKILVVNNFYRSTAPSGENITVDMQVKALAEAGHDVRLVSMHSDKFHGKLLHPIRAGINVATGMGKSPLEEIRDFDPTIVHVHNLFPNFSTKWLKEWDGPVVATLHNFRPLCANGLLFRDGHTCTLCPTRGQHHAIIHACYRESRLATAPLAYRNRNGPDNDAVLVRANKLVALSERARSTYELFGVDQNRLSLIPNFIEDYNHDSHDKQSARSWIYAGRLTPEKGILRLLSTWPDNESIMIVGAGQDSDAIREIARDRANVNFAGVMSRNELLRLLPSAKGALIPSLCAENLPTVYLESLAAGIPVVAKSGNSVADDLGIWAPELTYSSEESLRGALHYANETWHETSSAARTRFTTTFSKRSWIEATSNLYESLL